MNEISILFSNDYASDGEGLHSFIDTDEKQYLYSNCEPANCRKWFPCFDQPDIKGSLELYAMMEADWVGISNEVLVDSKQ